MSLFELLSYIQHAGDLVAPVFAVLYWLERNERQDAQKELKDVATNSVAAMVELRAVVNQLAMIFNGQFLTTNRKN